MRRSAYGLFAVAIVMSGCGSSTKFANKPRPATPVDLTVYIDSSRVSVSPASTGAGELIFIITNQASTAESLTIAAAGDPSHTLASTSPINPQAASQVAVDLSTPGNYTVSATSSGGTQAATATRAPIKPATLHVGAPRASASNVLLQP